AGLFEGGQVLVPVGPREHPLDVAVEVGEMSAGDDGADVAVARDVGESRMQLGDSHEEVVGDPCAVGVLDCLQRLGNAAVAPGIAHMLTAQAKVYPADRAPHLDEVQQILDRQLADAGRAVGQQFHHPLAHQDVDTFAHRSLAEAQFVHQVACHNDLPGRVFTRTDPAEHHVDDTLDGRRAAGSFPVRGPQCVHGFLFPCSVCRTATTRSRSPLTGESVGYNNDRQNGRQVYPPSLCRRKIVRRRQMTTKALLAALVGFALFSSGIANAADPVRIGFSAAKTGLFAGAADGQIKTYELWKDAVNAGGGLDVKGVKRPVEFVFYDDQSDPGKAVQIYEKLITDDKVDLLLAPYGTPAHIAIAGVVERHKFPLVGNTAASVKLR